MEGKINMSIRNINQINQTNKAAIENKQQSKQSNNTKLNTAISVDTVEINGKTKTNNTRKKVLTAAITDTVAAITTGVLKFKGKFSKKDVITVKDDVDNKTNTTQETNETLKTNANIKETLENNSNLSSEEFKEKAKAKIETKIPASLAAVSSNKAELGTMDNPIILDALDVSSSNNTKTHTKIFFKDGKIYEQSITIDTPRCPNEIGIAARDALTMRESYRDCDIKRVQRRMQYGTATKEGMKDEVQGICNKLKKSYDSYIRQGLVPWNAHLLAVESVFGMSVFGAEDNFTPPKGALPAHSELEDKVYDKLINDAKNNLEKQKLELRKLKPIKKECILWCGVKPDNSESDEFYENKLSSVLNNSLKPGDKVVLDGAAMRTGLSPDAQPITRNERELIRIKAPAGSRLVSCGNGILLPSGSNFKFLGKSGDDKGLTVWDFEYILPVLDK